MEQPSLTKYHMLLEKFSLPSPHNPTGQNPALMTIGEYLHAVDPAKKDHPDTSYDVDLEHMNQDLGSGNWRDKSKFPIFLKRVKLRGIYFEFRLSVTKNVYNKFDHEKMEHIRDENGDVIPYSDEENAAAGRQIKEYSIAVYDEDGRCVATTGDEWGCMLIQVAKEYRGFGLGPVLIRLARHFEPLKPSGGFTSGGQMNFIKMHRGIVRDALKNGFYNKMVKAGKITVARVKEIIDSAHLDQKPKDKDQLNLNNKDPNDWLVLAEYGGFTVYDKKLKDVYQHHLDTFGERFILGHALVRVLDHRAAGLLVQFGAETDKLKSFLLACVASFCASEKVSLWVDPEDMAYIDHSKYNVAKEPDMITGKKRTKVSIKQPLNLALIATPDKVYRKSFDKYGEFKNTVLELADAKFR